MSALYARAVLALVAATAFACGGLHPPPAGPTDAAAVAEAHAVLEELAARRGDIRLVEGGMVVQAKVYASQHSVLWELPKRNRPDEVLDPGDHYVVEEEILVGPHEVYVAHDRVRAVWVRSWSFGQGVELELAGEPDRIVLEAEDRGEAERLAVALEHLRRAGVSDEGAPAPAP